MKLNFNWKYKTYEMKACPKSLARFYDNEPNETIDLLKWEESADGRKSCFSLAYFVRGREGYYLKFVGGRPFDYIAKEDVPVLWKALKIAQGILNAFFDVEGER